MTPGRMKKGTGLSRRLAAMADLLPETESLADIGTDHGGLLIYLISTGRIRQGIGVEIAQGPFERASANVSALGLGDRIEIRRGDGLKPLAPSEVTACAVAGLGGKTIRGILDGSPEVAGGLSWLLLQPMTGAGTVRIYLQENGWRICGESLVEEKGILYEIILAHRGKMERLSRLEAEFGPILLAEKPPLLELAIRRKIMGLQHIAARLEKSASAESAGKKIRLTGQIKEWEALLK